MKKQTFILITVALFICIFSSSCNNSNTMEPANDFSASTKYFELYPNHWEQVIQVVNNVEVWDEGHWYCRLDVPAINESVIENGAVFVYYYDNNDNWVLLPYSTALYDIMGNPFSEEIWFGYNFGRVDIDFVRTNKFNLTPPDILDIKVVIMKY